MSFQQFVGKTVESVDTSSVNCVIFRFSDGTEKKVFAECASDGIPFFEFDDDSTSRDVAS